MESQLKELPAKASQNIVHHRVKHVLHTGREFLTHWMVAGLIVAATGIAPEHWVAHVVEDLHIPADAMHLWAANVDMRMLIAGLGLMLVVGDIAWRWARPHAAPAASPAGAAWASVPDVPPLPDKPSIAVLPFDNLSSDPAQEYFSDGVAEDITTELSRSRSLFVIARNSAFSYRGRAMDVKLIARELGVRYILEGSVRRDSERVRVTAQLSEAETGTHIWAERFDRDQQSMFAIQDEITQAVATQIGLAVSDAEMLRAMRRPPNSLGAWDLYQQGLWHLTKVDAAQNEAARHLFEQAIERDPMFAPAYVGLAYAHLWAGARYLTRPMEEETRLSAVSARKAVELDPGDADALAALAWALMIQGDMDESVAVARQGLSINPNCARAHQALGAALIFMGRTIEGRQAMDVFARLSPRDTSIGDAHSRIAISYYFEHDYERCVETARRLLSSHPDSPLTYRWLAAALGQLGRTEEAHAALKKALALFPREFDVYVNKRVPWMSPTGHGHLLEGLRKAGWQG